MKNIYLRRLFRFPLSCFLFLSGGFYSAFLWAEPVRLNYAFFAPAQTFPAIQMEKWADELNKRTGVKVNTFPGGTLLSASNMFDGVESGVADIGLSVVSYDPQRFPLLSLTGSLTGMDKNGRIASQVLYRLIKEFPEHVGLDNFKVITAFASEPAYLQTNTPIINLKDMQGLEVRVPSNAADAVRALGGVPVILSHADTAEAIQTGIVDGNVSSREVLKDLQLARTLKYVVDYPLINAVMIAVMNKDKWESLPDNIKVAIDELGSEMAYFAGNYLDNHIASVMNWSKEEHQLTVISLSPEEREKWNEALHPVNEAMLKSVESKGLPAYALHKRQKELINQYKN
ncbi:TRAP transporter substrate-binding protein [Oceanisphaera sp.]|uniref:TRAP transporter substrate-binding protein n=1 Tax=Oceanisphaera sp. TaxID=1929979 RepID=UPI003A9560AF